MTYIHASRFLNEILWTALSATAAYFMLRNGKGWEATLPAICIAIFTLSAVRAYRADDDGLGEVGGWELATFLVKGSGLMVMAALLATTEEYDVPLWTIALVAIASIPSVMLAFATWRKLRAQKRVAAGAAL